MFIVLDSKNVMLLTLLHYVLKPAAAIPITVDRKKSVWRASISDSIQSMVLEVPNLNDLSSFIEERLTKYRQANFPLQPFVFFIGSVYHPTHFYIYFGGEYLKFDNVVSSLDTCFKIYQVFNYNYPKESTLVWIFIQQFFYKINTKFDTYCQVLIEIQRSLSLQLINVYNNPEFFLFLMLVINLNMY